MKRRAVLRSILSLPAITALPAAAQQTPSETKPRDVDGPAHLQMTAADAVVATPPSFFTPEQFRVLARLCDLLVPAAAPKPGAKDAAVPEFLDFLIARSPADRQQLYRTGLDRLDAEARRRFDASFAVIHDPQAAELLASLHQPWKFEPPSDDLARFLASAKEDALRATVNSREWGAASMGRRGGRGMGFYWYSLE